MGIGDPGDGPSVGRVSPARCGPAWARGTGTGEGKIGAAQESWYRGRSARGGPGVAVAGGDLC